MALQVALSRETSKNQQQQQQSVSLMATGRCLYEEGACTSTLLFVRKTDSLMAPKKVSQTLCALI